jgi:hypothetical protein
LNYAEIRLSLRPRTIFEILDLALVVFRRSFVNLWPFYAASGLIWAAALAGVARIPEDPDRWIIVLSILLPLALFIRFFLQMIIVTFCGRWIFSEQVTLRSLFADIRQVGLMRMLGRGLVRSVKWASGFALLVPLWLVLVHRFFDYEHWLLERISGRDLRRRLRSFHSGRVFAFRILHFCVQLLYLYLASFGVKVLLESATRMPREETLSVELTLTLLLAYEPFFLISRFLLYIQTRIDTEAWDIGLMLREGIRKTLTSRIASLLLLGCLVVVPLRAQTPDPYITAPADRPCTESMKEQPYVKCDPTEYRVYTAEEIEKTIPRELEKRDPGSGGINPAVFETIAYGVVIAALAALLFFLWNRYSKRLPEAPPEAEGRRADVQEFEVLKKEDRLTLIRDALQREAYKTALGHCYLFIMEKNETPGSTMLALTPEELRLKLRSLDDGGTGVDEMLVKYEQVFYAGSDPVSARDHIMRLLETGAVQ